MPEMESGNWLVARCLLGLEPVDKGEDIGSALEWVSELPVISRDQRRR